MHQVGGGVVTRKGQAFRCLSGMAICVPVGTLGLMEVDYWGSLTKPAYIELRVSVLAATRSAAALVVRMDNAAMLLGQQPTPPSPMKSAGAPAGALVVRADQFQMFSDYARALSAVGVVRAVFLPSQLASAYSFAEHHARAWPPSSQRAQGGQPRNTGAGVALAAA